MIVIRNVNSGCQGLCFVAVYEIQMIELPSPYGDCEPSETYVQSKCLAECQANHVIGECDCKEIYVPGQNKNATNITGL